MCVSPQFGLYEGLGAVFSDPSGPAYFLRGLVSGSLSKLIVYPLDTVKRRLQVCARVCVACDCLSSGTVAV